MVPQLHFVSISTMQPFCSTFSRYMPQEWLEEYLGDDLVTELASQDSRVPFIALATHLGLIAGFDWACVFSIVHHF